MLKDNVHKMLQDLAVKIYKEIIARMDSPIGVNYRANANTLVGSNLMKSVEVDVSGDEQLVFSIADYYEFIVAGWKRSGNFPGTKDKFLANLLDWIRRKGIHAEGMTETRLAYLSILRRGIRPRPFINSGYNNGEDPSKVLPFLNEFFSTWADGVWEEINKEIEKRF